MKIEMMKTKYLAIAAAALELIACDKNNDDFNIDNTKDTPITIASAGVAELSTRVITDDNKLEGVMDGESATMSVFVTGGSEAKYNATNLKWEHDGIGWDSEAVALFEGTSSQQKIYACSPFFDGSTGSIAVTATDQTDWLVATTKSLSSNKVTLAMTHALAKLVLVPIYGTELTNQTISSLEIGGMYTSGTLNISDNTWSNCGTASATLPMTNMEVLVIPMAECESFPITITMADSRTFNATISLTFVEHKLEAGTFMEITVTDNYGKYEFSVPVNDFLTDTGIEAGKHYSFSLKVGKDAVSINSVSVIDWAEKDIDGGVAKDTTE